MRQSLALLTLAMMMTTTVSADQTHESKKSNGYHKCSGRAYVSDIDPKGLNLRAGPGIQYPIVGNVPAKSQPQGPAVPVGPTFEVLGFQSGWFHVKSSGVYDLGGTKSYAMFKGLGWVSQKKVSFAEEEMVGDMDIGYSRPDKKSTIVYDFNKMKPDDVRISSMIDCRGNWRQVDVEFRAKGARRRTPHTTAWYAFQ